MNKYFEWFVYYKRQILVIGGILISVFVLLGIGLWKFYFHTNLDVDMKDEEIIFTEEKEEVLEKEIINEEVQLELKNLVAIDIKGAINNPGVYQVVDTSRVKDVIDVAGGVRNDADLSVINLSKKVFDEMVIIIYTKDEVNNFVEVKKQEEEKQEKCVIVEEKLVNNACICEDNVKDNTNLDVDTSKEETNNKESVISLNTATKEELMTLSGIGESKALLIIEYRETNNGFKTIDEIKNIKGIGDSIFEKIKERLTV